MPRDFHSPEGIDEWLQSLDDRWPARANLAQHIIEQIDALPNFGPHVLELAPGGGKLAEQLLSVVPATYTAVDFSRPLLERSRQRLSSYAHRVQLIHADLNEDDWPPQVTAPVHAIFSLQSLHDLGDGRQVERIYQIAYEILAPGGLLLNADFLHNPEDPRPGRLPIEQHLRLLHTHGFQRPACTLEIDGFGCIAGFAGLP